MNPAPPAHTPLPWKLDTSVRGLAEITTESGSSIATIETDLYQMGDAVTNVANGELIVRTVNSHASLLAALEAVKDDIESNDFDGCLSMATFEKVAAALAKATA